MSTDLVKIAADVLGALLKTPSYEPLSLTEEKKDRAVQLLLSDDVCATSAFRAAQTLLGQQFIAWEPESIWMELDDNGVDLSEKNRDKVMAVSSLLQYPAFYWDVNIFEDTAMAFNNEHVIPMVLQEASPAQLSWAVYEAELLTQADGNDPDFDYEPARYAAVCLYREGMLVAPELLEFAQDALDTLNRGNRDLVAKVRSRWEKVREVRLSTLELEETPIDVQIGRLAAIKLYVDERAEKLQTELKALEKL